MVSPRDVIARELYAWALGLERPPDMRVPSDSYFETADRILMALLEGGLSVMPTDEIEACERLRGRMALLLDRTANALNGKPPRNTMHSWHDLPEKAAAAREDG